MVLVVCSMYLICVAQSSVLKERNSKLIETILESYYRNYHSLIGSDEMIKLELVSVLRNQSYYYHDDGPVRRFRNGKHSINRLATLKYVD